MAYDTPRQFVCGCGTVFMSKANNALRCQECRDDYNRKTSRDAYHPVDEDNFKKYELIYCPDDEYRKGAKFDKLELQFGISNKHPSDASFPVGTKFQKGSRLYQVVKSRVNRVKLEVLR